MKNKKIFSFILLVATIMTICCSPFISSASVFYIDGDAEVCPGSTRVYVDQSDYNYAWINDVVMRDSSSSVVPLVLHPLTAYPYSHTSEEFVSECNNYAALFNTSESILESSFYKTLSTAYYSLLASGKIKSDEQTMRAYNESRGITYPYSQGSMTHMYTTLVYALLKTDIASAVLNQEIEIPRGTSVEGAVVLYLAKVCGMNVPATTDSIESFAYQFANEYVLEESSLPVSKDPSKEEVYYWVKVLAADKQGYSVPKTTPYAKVSQKQETDVTNAYYASILTTKYGIYISPELLGQALVGDKSTNVPKLVLKSMLDSVNITYSDNESIESLFDKAKVEGFFELEDDFYSDIYDYEVTVSSDSTEVWFTAFLVADQLVDGNVNYAKTYIDGKLVENSSTNSVKLTGDTTKFTVRIEYSDSKRYNKAEYTFTVKKSLSGSNVVGGINVDLNEPVENILGSVDSAVNNYVQNSNSSGYAGSVSDYSSTNSTTYALGESSSTSNTSSLLETYPTDENGNVLVTSDPLATTEKAQENATSVLSGVTQTIKDKPEYVATPISLLAVGASAGYIFIKRRKNAEVIVENESIDDPDDIEIE